MKKNEILNSLWNFISTDGFSKNYWGIYEELAQKSFFQKGLKRNKKELQTIYNLYVYGYYNNEKQKIYYDVLN